MMTNGYSFIFTNFNSKSQLQWTGKVSPRKSGSNESWANSKWPLVMLVLALELLSGSFSGEISQETTARLEVFVSILRAIKDFEEVFRVDDGHVGPELARRMSVALHCDFERVGRIDHLTPIVAVGEVKLLPSIKLAQFKSKTFRIVERSVCVDGHLNCQLVTCVFHFGE